MSYQCSLIETVECHSQHYNKNPKEMAQLANRTMEQLK